MSNRNCERRGVRVRGKSVILSLILLCPAAPASAQEAINADFCDLIMHSKDYADQLVEFDAEVLPYYHGSALIDERCYDLGGVGLWESRGQEIGGDIRQLRRLISGPPLRGIFARFRGTYRNNEEQDPQRFLEDNIPFRVLELSSVSNVRVVQKR